MPDLISRYVNLNMTVPYSELCARSTWNALVAKFKTGSMKCWVFTLRWDHNVSTVGTSRFHSATDSPRCLVQATAFIDLLLYKVCKELWHVHWSPRAAVTCYCKLGGFKRWRFIPSQLWRLEMWDQGVDMAMLPPVVPGKTPPLPSPASCISQCSLSWRRVSPIFASHLHVAMCLNVLISLTFLSQGC